jgi:hypothetical protein
MDGSSKGRKTKLALRRWRETASAAPEGEYRPQGRVIVPFVVIEKTTPESDARILVLLPATD